MHKHMPNFGYISKQTTKKANVFGLHFRWVVVVLLLGLSIYYLLPQAGQLQSAILVLRSANPAWIFMALGATLGTYLAAAFVVVGSTSIRLKYSSVFTLQIATTAINRITPKGIGGLVLTEQYLCKNGSNRSQAASSITFIIASGIAAHIALMVLAFAFVDYQNIDFWNLTTAQLQLVAALAVFIILGAFLIPKVQSQLHKWYRELLVGLIDKVKNPKKLLQLIGGSTFITLFYALALFCSLKAFGSAVPFGVALLVYLVGNTLAAPAPTPGGLGAIEAALVVGLSAAQVEIDQAVAGVLIFRLLTFWLPILPGALALKILSNGYLKNRA